ncbi:MAG: family 2 glycosyl transferase [Opitutus sp.]|nr:family 2 glycosyl transferase [Opitutus sp.]
MPRLSAVICTYAPRADYLLRVIGSYAAQTLPSAERELIIVDSGSPVPLSGRSDLPLPAGTRLLRTARPGLALARLTGIRAAAGDCIAALDDDTVMEPDYLAAGLDHLDRNPRCASVSGRLRGEFESPPPAWIGEFHTLLALRDLGERIITAEFPAGEPPGNYPDCAPLGANLSRRDVCLDYFSAWERDASRRTLGRNAGSLASGEDNDFALFVLKSGRSVAYLPAMRLLHLIPARRLDPDYLARLNHASQRTWTHVLLMNGISPWPAIPRWTVPLRQAKAWFSCRAWNGPVERIRWRGACGHFEGRALPRSPESTA